MEKRAARGYTLVAMMVGITILMVMIAAVLPLISTQVQREKEEELIFRGRQYAEGIRCFRRRYGRYPTSLQEMLDARPRTLRKLWKDPITNTKQWGLVSAVAGAPMPGTTPPPGGPGGSTFGGSGSSFGGSGSGIGGFGSSFGSKGARATPVPTPDPTDGSPREGDGDGDGRSGGFGSPRSGSPDGQDPMAPGPVSGVYSRSPKKAKRMYQGRDVYRDWRFTESVFMQNSTPDMGGPGGPRGPGGVPGPGGVGGGTGGSGGPTRGGSGSGS